MRLCILFFMGKPLRSSSQLLSPLHEVIDIIGVPTQHHTTATRGLQPSVAVRGAEDAKEETWKERKNGHKKERQHKDSQWNGVLPQRRRRPRYGTVSSSMQTAGFYDSLGRVYLNNQWEK
jgi:hypothetical protein